MGRDAAGRLTELVQKTLEPFDWVESRPSFRLRKQTNAMSQGRRQTGCLGMPTCWPSFTLAVCHHAMLATMTIAGSALVPQLALSRAAAPCSPRVSPLRMAVEGTGPGVGDYVYFAAVLALIPLIVGSVGSSVRLPNEPASRPAARPTHHPRSVRRSSSSRAAARPTTRR